MSDIDNHPLRYSPITAAIEVVLTRRMLTNRLDGYALESAIEVADAALLACGYEEMRRALEAAEKAERYHMNCKHCDGLEQPEACEKCFPKADDARLARWASLKAIGSKLAPREPRAALSRTQGEG